jgi:DNA/RNA endonuclease YhcR with UshA esterase domain
MKTKFMCVWLAALILTLGTSPLWAHHSFVAEYDINKPVTLKGTVKKLEWTNPHARFYIEVKDANGAVTNWELELGSPNTLIRYGWKRDSMKVGDEVIVEGYLAKDGSKLANAKTVKFSDGRVVNAGSSADLNATK